VTSVAPPLLPPSVRDRLEHLIGGEWVGSSGADRIAVVSPSTERPVADVVQGTAEDADRAVRAAHDAWPLWAARPVEERIAIVRALGAELLRRADELGTVIATEVGMPRRIAVAAQVGLPAAVIDRVADVAAEHPWEERVGSATVVREPAGVVAAITPWNMPLHQIAAKVAPALIAGCAMVLKPSEIAPLNAFVFAECAQAAGVPAGVFNLVCGSGPQVGEALVTHPLVAVVSLTGSVRSGARVAALAASGIKRVCLELGGKSPNIVLDDADLEVVIPSALEQAFFNSGQACNALSRLVVPRDRLDEIEERLMAGARALRVGDPFDDGVHLGPLVSAQQRDSVRGHIRAAIEDGARLLTGGPEAPPGLTRGYYQVPTVFSDVTPAMRLGCDEVFGPVLAVQPYAGEDDAVEIANSTEYGLSGGVWSADVERARRVARRIRSGQVKINGARTREYLDTPFGGYGLSGLGRELGSFGIDEFVEIKAILG
jgi:acyl-CoA reductase-like NAD-dependent aldehyde dehydrogenase